MAMNLGSWSATWWWMFENCATFIKVIFAECKRQCSGHSHVRSLSCVFVLMGISNKLLALVRLLLLLLCSARCGRLCGARVAGQLSFYEVKMCCWTKAMRFNAQIVNMLHLIQEMLFLSEQSQTWGWCGTLRLCVTALTNVYAFFWVITRRLEFICRRFGTHCLFHLHRHLPAYEDGKDRVFRNVGI
jgi:hypothetical protein